MHNRYQRVLDVNRPSGLESDLLDIFVSTPASSSSSLPPTTSCLSSGPPLPSSSSSTTTTTTSFYSTTIPTTAAQAGVSHITNPDITTDTTPTSSDPSDEDQNYTCPR
nr:unnamed protein product [Spirometra erinaceieuropaei]